MQREFLVEKVNAVTFCPPEGKDFFWESYFLKNHLIFALLSQKAWLYISRPALSQGPDCQLPTKPKSWDIQRLY